MTELAELSRDDEDIAQLIGILKKLSPGGHTMFGLKESQNIGEVIESLEKRTAEGMELLKLHRQIRERVGNV